jgi:hypothetical protein
VTMSSSISSKIVGEQPVLANSQSEVAISAEICHNDTVVITRPQDDVSSESHFGHLLGGNTSCSETLNY